MPDKDPPIMINEELEAKVTHTVPDILAWVIIGYQTATWKIHHLSLPNSSKTIQGAEPGKQSICWVMSFVNPEACA